MAEAEVAEAEASWGLDGENPWAYSWGREAYAVHQKATVSFQWSLLYEELSPFFGEVKNQLHLWTYIRYSQM